MSISISSSQLPTQTGLVEVGPLTTYIASPIGATTLVPFASATSVSLTIPTGTTSVVITMPPAATNTTQVILKGAMGDNGIILGLGGSSKLDVDPTETTIVLTSVGIVIGNVQVTFL